MGRRKKKKRKLRSASTSKTSAEATEKKAPKKGEAKKGETKKGETKKGETKKGETKKGETKKGEAKKKRDAEKKKKAPTIDNAFDRYFFAPVAPVRPYLLLRLALLLLAFDCWVDLIPHAGRYGVGDFNVAHFAILEILPTPTPGLYIGTLLFTGWLAMVMAIRPARSGMALLFVLYTYGWSMSMLDSYQHHYLLSLLLFSCIFFPFPAATELFGPTGEKREKDLGPWRIVGGLLLLFFLADLVMAACGLRAPLDRMFGDSGMLNGLRATAILLGVLLILMVGEGPKPEGKRSSAWGYVSFCVTCAIVYFYTAITKLAKDWREGHALRRLGNSDAFQELQAQAIGDEGLPLFGTMTVDEFWELMATGAILVQLASATGFLLAAGQDRLAGWKRYVVAAFGFAPLSFHLGVERMGLEIGWFSYYMLLIVFVVFLPVEVLRPIGAAFSWPARFLADRFGSEDEEGEADDEGDEKTTSDARVWGLVGAGAMASIAVAASLDLPGAAGASVLLGATLVAGCVLAVRKGRVREARGWGLGALVAAGSMWLSITQLNDVRYDYYRFVGGDHRRRGEFEEALVAYEKANAYQLHPWCLMEGRSKGDCFGSEEAAEARAAELGPEWSVMRSDRKDKEEEMRARVEAMRAAEGDE